MNIVKSYMTNNPCYKADKKLTVKGLMLHSVGCSQPSAKVFINNWNNEHYNAACVHGFIDGITGTIYETLPYEVRGWHCGSGEKGSANDTHIGIEMCEPSQIRYTQNSDKFTVDSKKLSAAKKVVERTYHAAVEYFAYLCDRFKLNPKTDIISHLEGAKMGIASAHSDPEHLWSGLNLPYTMDIFREDVAMELEKIQDASASLNTEDKFEPIMVRVRSAVLRIRKGPGTNYETNGYTGIGVFTITEFKEGPGSRKGWGKLKSGAGWISLDYAENVV